MCCHLWHADFWTQRFSQLTELGQEEQFYGQELVTCPLAHSLGAKLVKPYSTIDCRLGRAYHRWVLVHPSTVGFCTCLQRFAPKLLAQDKETMIISNMFGVFSVIHPMVVTVYFKLFGFSPS